MIVLLLSSLPPHQETGWGRDEEGRTQIHVRGVFVLFFFLRGSGAGGAARGWGTTKGGAWGKKKKKIKKGLRKCLGS